MSHETSLPNPPSLESYLQERQIRSPFVMVEIGHGRTPVAHKLQNLTDQRAYIGIESWFYDLPVALGEYTNYLEQLRSKRADLKNVFFMDHPLHPTDKVDARQEYTGAMQYDPTTILPDHIADEILLSNVVGDPRISDSSSRTNALLQECARLVTPKGVVVFRETLTPQNALLDEQTLALAGLKTAHQRVTQESAVWDKLEQAYSGREWQLYNANSFYAFAVANV